MTKVGLGSLGVVMELTLKCVPLYRLKDEIIVNNREKILNSHSEKLNNNRHLRYLWIPYTDCVVSYESNITDDHNSKLLIENEKSKDEFKKLLLLRDPNHSPELLQSYNFALFRDILLDQNPLDLDHVKSVNLAEKAYWKEN
jgi:L-galactono-1,4-lactone dehydrogenase